MEVRIGYKQTEIGVIPDDWEVKSLGEIGECIIGLTYSPNDVGDYGTLVLRSSNVQNNKLAFDNNVFVKMELPERVFVKENDILICVRNGSKHLIGKCAIIDKSTEGSAFGAFMAIYRTKYYGNVFYQFQSNIIQKQIDENLGATINQITNKNLASYKIPLPSTTEEQTAIANALSDTDVWINSLEQLLTKKRQIKQGAMQELLQPKEDWEEKKLGEIGEIITGGTPPTNVSEYWNGSIPWITPTDINSCKNIFSSEREISENGLNVIRKLPKNTLLVTCIASIGKNTILRKAGACNQQINAIVPNSNNNVDFLYYLIENNKNYILGKAGITATLMISKKDFSQILFSFPNTEEQTRIATILSDMDEEIAQLEKKLAKAKQIKQGMMQELLTGRIRLV